MFEIQWFMNYILFTIPLDNFPFLQIRHHNFWLIYRCKILVIGLYAHILWPGIEETLLCHIICDMGPCILQSCPIKGKSSLDARGTEDLFKPMLQTITYTAANMVGPRMQLLHFYKLFSLNRNLSLEAEQLFLQAECNKPQKDCNTSGKWQQ